MFRRPVILSYESENKLKNTTKKNIYYSHLPLSSSCNAVFASCQLSELLDVLSPKFNTPTLDKAAILESHIPKAMQNTELAGNSWKKGTNRWSGKKSSRAFEFRRKAFPVLGFANDSDFHKHWKEMTLLTSIFHRQLVPSPLRRSEYRKLMNI